MKIYSKIIIQTVNIYKCIFSHGTDARDTTIHLRSLVPRSLREYYSIDIKCRNNEERRERNELT